MTVRAECENCSTLVELEDSEENRLGVEGVAEIHSRETGHQVRVFVREEIASYLCDIEVELESHELEDAPNPPSSSDSNPSSDHVA